MSEHSNLSASQEHLAGYYRRIHESKGYYGSAWRPKMRQRMFGRFIAEHGGENILDVGARDGFLNKDILDGKSVTAIDIDDEALRRYRAAYADLKPAVLQQDVNAPLDLPSASQDIVIAGEVIEHLSTPKEFVAEVHRVLTPGGIFIGSTPNAFRLDRRLRMLWGMDPKDFSDETHLQYYSRSSIEATLSERFDNPQVIPYVGSMAIDSFAGILADGFIWRAEK